MSLARESRPWTSATRGTFFVQDLRFTFLNLASKEGRRRDGKRPKVGFGGALLALKNGAVLFQGAGGTAPAVPVTNTRDLMSLISSLRMQLDAAPVNSVKD